MSDQQPPADAKLTRIGWNSPAGLDEATIARVVNAFYADARRDPVIGPVFNRAISEENWPNHLAKIADFWSSMLLGTGRYGGRPLPKHMAIPELSDVHFQRWLLLFRQTVLRLCSAEIAELFIERSERVGNSFRMNIAMRRGEDITRMGPLQREEF